MRITAMLKKYGYKNEGCPLCAQCMLHISKVKGALPYLDTLKYQQS